MITTAKNSSNTAILRVKEVRRPLSREIIGYRIQAAVPNLEARAMLPVEKQGEIVAFRPGSKLVPSFAKKYLIAESSDYSAVGDREWQRFIERLKWQGIYHVEFLDEKED